MHMMSSLPFAHLFLSVSQDINAPCCLAPCIVKLVSQPHLSHLQPVRSSSYLEGNGADAKRRCIKEFSKPPIRIRQNWPALRKAELFKMLSCQNVLGRAGQGRVGENMADLVVTVLPRLWGAIFCTIKPAAICACTVSHSLLCRLTHPATVCVSPSHQPCLFVRQACMHRVCTALYSSSGSIHLGPAPAWVLLLQMDGGRGQGPL